LIVNSLQSALVGFVPIVQSSQSNRRQPNGRGKKTGHNQTKTLASYLYAVYGPKHHWAVAINAGQTLNPDSMDRIRVLQTDLRFPNGLTFDEDGCLWCAEQLGEGLYCRATDGQASRIHTGGTPTSVVYADGTLWFSDSATNSIRRMDADTKTVETILDNVRGEPLATPGNLAFDAAGNLLFTCSGPANGSMAGWVTGRHASGYAEVIADGLAYPNGLAFLPGMLLIAETHRQRIWAGFWDENNLSWETIHVWTDMTESRTPVFSQSVGPADMAVSPEGEVYVTVTGQGLIRVFSDEGVFVRDIELPGHNPTSCAFDPSNQLGLVVAEAERGELLSITEK